MPARPELRVLVVANQKGGVGKTTTAINLGTALAAIGEKVLLIESDPQGNASTGLGIGRALRKHTLYDVLMGEKTLIEGVVKSSVPGLDVVPSDPDLSGIEMELSQQPRRSYKLRDAIDPVREAGTYSCVLIDRPPSLNLLTVNAMAAADAVLVPLQCEFFALEGLTQLMRTIELVHTSLNPKLGVQGIVLTMFDRRNGLCGPGGQRRARPLRRDGLPDGDPPQCAGLRGAQFRQARPGLRPEMRRQPGLPAPRPRGGAARTGPA